MSTGYHDSKTPEPQRDLWQTPPYVFKYYDARFNFSHDVAATASNALANCYYTEDDDALTKDWGACCMVQSTLLKHLCVGGQGD